MNTKPIEGIFHRDAETWERSFRTRSPQTLKEMTPITVKAAYDPADFEAVLDQARKELAEPQLVEIWRPAFLMSGVGQTFVLHQRFWGHVWLSSFKMVDGAAEDESPTVEVTITPTNPEDKS